MPKMKTHSSAKKRFKVTGSGKVKRFQAGVRHNTGKKATKRKLRLRGSSLVAAADQPRMLKLLLK